MKLSQYAKQIGVTYKTAYRWWKAGKLDAYQLSTGTIVVREQQTAPSGVALYVRASSDNEQQDIDRQLQRLRDFAAAKGYTVVREITEIASGVNDQRPKLNRLLTDPKIGVIVVESPDRLARFGYYYITTLMEMQGRRIEAIFPNDTSTDLMEDCVAALNTVGARVYGRRNSKQRVEQIKQCIERYMLPEQAEEQYQTAQN